MLKFLFIQNYVLIEKLELDFSNGFSVFTGETGSGKSILLGALGLILGDRVKRDAIGINDEKCVIEGVFEGDSEVLNNFFVQNDLEISTEIIIRRILWKNGKSKAFINEEPVRLEMLKSLGNYLVDIHSQHQNLHLKKQNFQLQVIDGFAKTYDELKAYQKLFHQFETESKQLNALNEKIEQETQNLEFYNYQLEKFEQVDLEQEETKMLEKELERLNHGEEIQQKLHESLAVLQAREDSVLQGLGLVQQHVQTLKKYLPAIEKLDHRLESHLLELTDCAQEIKSLIAQTEFDAERLADVQQKMTILYQLYEVFRVSSLDELLNKKSELEQKIYSLDALNEDKIKLEKSIEKKYSELKTKAKSISTQRQAVLPELKLKIEKTLHELGMEHAIFCIEHSIQETLNMTGQDKINFLFSANKNQTPGEIAKIASGGEISRIMLTLKSLMTQSIGFPTIIFDEVDTGVSGHVAEKMGYLMSHMAQSGQVFAITHLPQIATKAQTHFYVKKVHGQDSTQTKIELLSETKRVEEIAQMLSGSVISEEAKAHARGMLRK